jgi:acetyl esterase/lipase
LAAGGRLTFDPGAIAARVAELGTEVTPEALRGSMAIYAPFHEQEPYRDVRVARDVAYGPHARQRVDVFSPVAPGGGRPVLAFFHGGGFVAGDKRRAGTPYNDNVALWAVRRGMVGVNATYRLAPDFQWPSGARDVAAVLGWLRANVAAHGGDPDRIHLVGTSAGAVHVASHIALEGGAGAAGAILLSGAYDLTTFDRERTRVYFGDDPARYAERSPLRALVDEPVPALYVLAEHDPPAAQRQALTLVSAYWERHGRWPRFLRLFGHNHFTVTAHLNTPDDVLGREIERFVDRS